MTEESFLAARAKAAAANEEWSRAELGEWVAVLDMGCAILERCAKSVDDHLVTRGDSASAAEHAVSLLAMLAESRAGSVCSLLLQGYPIDAGALLRGLLEIEAMQTLLAGDAESAERWYANEEIKEREYLKAVTADDSTFGPAWGQLGTVVHPNRKAVINQVDETGGGARLGAGGARRPEQLFKLTVNFGVQVKREVRILERVYEINWPDGVAGLITDFSTRLHEMHTDVVRRWPGSETID